MGFIEPTPPLPNGPIPFRVDSTPDVDARRAMTDPDVVSEPTMRPAERMPNPSQVER